MKKIINEIEHFLRLAQSVEHETLNLSFVGFSLTLGDVFGLPRGSGGKESACNAGNLGLIPELGRSPGEGHGYPLQYSWLENSMERGAWRATVQGVAKSRTQLSKFHFLYYIRTSISSRVKGYFFLSYLSVLTLEVPLGQG